MKTSWFITEQPWLGICQEEWKRAKGIIRFSVNQPKFKWRKYDDNSRHGTYARFANIVFLNRRYKLLATDGLVEEFRLTLRHEFAHIRTSGHGRDFMINLERLGGNRFASLHLEKKRNGHT